MLIALSGERNHIIKTSAYLNRERSESRRGANKMKDKFIKNGIEYVGQGDYYMPSDLQLHAN